MPSRIDPHKIDTKANRKMIAQLDENWLVRDQQDRDYGIDLTIERYGEDEATGDYFFVQLKGKDEAFTDKVKLSSFPVKTIKYALLFNIPFFVFHTSIKSNQTKYVWLQKYAETKLMETTPNWKEQESITIYFPHENDLSDNPNKIVEIIAKDKSKKEGVKFLSLYEALKIHTDSVIHGEQFAVGEYCNSVSMAIFNMSSFLLRYTSNIDHSWKKIEVLNMADSFREISERLEVSLVNKENISRTMKHLEKIKYAFLDDDELDIFGVKMKAHTPY